ncbi:MAG: hypothetical protein HQM09_22265 [Candidatus Riflebacteria bacterium]|nr:hypothetical protein [Candidatus Riflebacteria bacterium]
MRSETCRPPFVRSCLVIALFASCLLFTNQNSCRAQNSEVSEEEQSSSILEQNPYKLERDKDPFQPLVKRPLPPKPVDLTPPVLVKPVTPIVHPCPSLRISVIGIVGNDGGRLAMIRLNDEIKFVREKDVMPEGFTIVEIQPERVVIYATREKIRRTFPLSNAQ